jgi:hypothetical protein
MADARSGTSFSADLRRTSRFFMGEGEIYVCPTFPLAQRRDGLQAEIVLLHEALHTLGLGENPPYSAEITGRVVARCGS